jgi:hypothetical protein
MSPNGTANGGASGNSSSGERARAQLIAWALGAVPAIAGGIGFAGFVALLGAGVVWIRFDAAQLPGDQALAKFSQGDLIGTGAVTLMLFLILGVLAVLLVYLLQSVLPAQSDRRLIADAREDIEEQLRSARGVLEAVDSDLAAAKGDPAVVADVAAFEGLRSNALDTISSLDQKLLEVEARYREASVAIPTAANQLGLSVLLVIEVIIVIWVSGASGLEKALFYIAAVVAAVAFGVVGRFTAIGKARPDTLFVSPRSSDTVGGAGTYVGRWSLLQFVLVLVPTVVVALLIDKWLAIPIIVAPVLFAGNLAIGKLHPRRFFWYGSSIFVSVTLFGAVLTYSRTQRDPSLQPAAVVLDNGKSFAGLYITETSDRLYLAHVDTSPDSGKPVKGSGRIFWLNRNDIRTTSIGPLQSVAAANKRSEVLKTELSDVP